MPTPLHPLIGQTPLAGRYDVSRLVGAGAVADVYLAHDRVLGRQVAIKASFYTLIANHQFDQAAQLWSQNMVNTWGIEDGIVRRFSSTTALVIKGIRLVSQADGHATVSVDLLEWKGGSSNPQELIGTWDLVQGPSGWLLDQAHF